MSKNSNKKQLNSRLNNVFADIDKPQAIPGLNASSDISGWIWEMTPTGIISGCSPDIEIFLEIPSHRLIDAELASFSDFSLETANLPSDPNRALMPTTLSINFHREDGSIVPTTTYILGKLDEDGNLISWRGITSVREPEETPTLEPAEPEALATEESIGLITMDDVPEIPQPDESVMDIWVHNEKDTSPLSPQDLDKDRFGDDSAEEIEEVTEAVPQDEIETIRYSSSPISQALEADSTADESESEEQKEVFEGEEEETEAVSFADPPPAHAVEFEETEELVSDVVHADEPIELVPPQEIEDLSQETLSSEELSAWSPEFATPPVETGQAEEQPAEKQPEPSPQDEIETIRYSSSPISQALEADSTSKEAQFEEKEAAFQVEEEKPETEAVSPADSPPAPPVEFEETEELVSDVMYAGESAELEPQQEIEDYSQKPPLSEKLSEWDPESSDPSTGPDTWRPEFKEQVSETFIPLSGSSQAESEEDPQAELMEPAESTPDKVSIEIETPAGEEPPAWKPEFSEPPVAEVQSSAEIEEFEQPSAEAETEEEQPTVPLGAEMEAEVGGTETQSLKIDEIPSRTPVTSTQPEEAAIQESIEQPTTEPAPEADVPSALQDREDPMEKGEVVTEPLETGESPTRTPEYAQPIQEPESVEAPSLQEDQLSEKRFKEPDTQPLKPFEDEKGLEIVEPEVSGTRIDSVSLMPDLDLQKEELESPSEEFDTDALDPFPQPPGTGPMRRPTIDTASLIPNLLGRTESPPEPERDTDTLSIEDFLREVEEESVQIDTKELETLTSSDGTELSISRGVQELLKIVDNNPNREWKEDELQLVEQVHTQLELALENANLFQQTQIALSETDERARQLRLLNQMSEDISQTDDLMEIYGIVTDKTIQIFNGQRVSITILSEDRTNLEVVAATGETSAMPIGAQFPLKDTSNEIVIRENRVFIPPGQRNLDFGEIKSTMVGPIMVSGKVIGTLNVGSNVSNAFNDRDANFLTQLLSILNASIENRRLFEQIETALSTTEEQARRLAVLNQLSEKLTLADSFEQVITLVLDYINQIIPADEWAYTHVNEEKKTYELFVAPDKVNDLPTQDGSPISMTQPLENSIVGKAAKDRRTIIEFNCLDSTFNDVRLWAEERGVRTAMSSPLVVGNQVLGVLNVGSSQQSAYTVQEENIMLSITSLAGSTIDNRELLGQIQKRSVQLETSAEVSRVASTMLDPAELLPRVVELIKDGFDLYYAGIFLIDDSGEITGEPGKWAVLRAGSGEAGQQMIGTGHKLEIGGDSMIGTAISTSQARIALSVGEEDRFFRNPFLPNTRSEMALPLTSRGEVLGALSIQSEKEDAFNQEDITALQTMADQLANAIENARLFEQTEMRAEELTVLNEMARGFTQSMEVDELIENTYQFTGRLMDASNFYLVLYYPDEQFLEFKLFVEDGQKIPPPRTRVKLGDGLTDWVINNKLPVLIPADTETHLLALGIEPKDRMPKSWLGVPMLLGNDVTGVIAVQNYRQANTYNSHSLDLLIAVSSQAAVAIDNARRFQATQTRARHEEILRRVTTQVHSTSDPEAILRTAVREVSDALGKPAFVKLTQQEKSVGPTDEKPTQTNPSSIPPQTPPAPQAETGDSEER